MDKDGRMGFWKNCKSSYDGVEVRVLVGGECSR